MRVADWLSGLDHRLGFANRARLRRRRAHHLVPVTAEVSPLEDRCLLTSALLGSQTLVNATLAGTQQFATDGGRSIDVTSSGTVIAVWSSTAAHHSRIVARQIGPDGSPLSGEIPISRARKGVRGEAVVAVGASGQFVVAWVSKGNRQDPSGLGVFARVFSPDGTALTREFRVNASVPGNQQDPSVAWVSADRFVVAWDGAGKGRAQSAFARVFNASGTPVTKEVLVPRRVAGTKQDAVVAALANGGFEVAWSDRRRGGAKDIFARQFDGAGKALKPEFRVNTARTKAASQPAIAVNGDQVVIAWQAKGDPLDPSRTGVVARRFAPDGTPLGGEFPVNQTTQGRQFEPSVALLDDSSIVVAWRGRGAGDSDGVYAREFFADGTPRAGEQLINTTVAGTQEHPTVRAQTVGRYVVGWDGNIGAAASGAAGAQAVTGDATGVALQNVGDTYINMPADTPGKTINDVLWYDASVTDPKFMKTITITNNSPDQTIYPFYEDANSRTALPTDPAPSPTYRGTGMFDPFDPINNEYRAYIGFHDATGDHLGLLPGKSITISVPLAFWDAGRINFTTDGAISKGGSDLLGPDPSKPPLDQANQPNPFRFFYNNPDQNVVGSTTPGLQTLTFTRIYDSFQNGQPYTDPNKKLLPSTIVPGMGVSGPGIPANDTVQSLGADGNSVTLSIAAIAADPNDPSNTLQTNVPYTFTAPAGATISPTDHVTVDALSGPDYPGSITNGRVMFYHALAAVNPVNDAPFQLSEPTMRGDYYAPANNPGFKYLIGFDYQNGGKTINVISANDFNLINYDVSYVDSMALPIAVSADNVPVVFPDPDNLGSYPYGWAGSSQKSRDMKAAIDAFTSTNQNGQDTNFLGDYFGGKGWPTYYNPNSSLDLKIPSGQNVFKESPFEQAASSYPVQQSFPDGTSILLPVNQLTSGGAGPASIAPGGTTAPSEGLPPNQVKLNNSTDADKARLVILRDQFARGQTFDVTASTAPLASDIPMGTTLIGVLTDNGLPTGTPTGVVELSQDTIAANRGNHTYTFARPLEDDAATPIMTLWYSWAQFYADYVQKTLGLTTPFDLTGHINPDKAEQIILDPGQPNAANVQPGMAVSSGGIPGTGCIVLAVSADKTTITLSKAAVGSGSYQFTPPALSALAGYKDKGVTWHLLSNFMPQNDGPAVDFSRTLYSVMAAMSTTVPGGAAYPSVQLLANIIGATISNLPNLNTDIQVIVTNQIKSLLRGVPDWTSPQYSDQSQWYPDPAVPTGAQKFNVYNLDPFVWFVHEKLGLSGYGFSIDDDTSDIGANGSRHLDLTYGGITDPNGNLNGVKNPSEWTTVAFYGPVSGTGKVVQNDFPQYPPGLTKITGLTPTLINQLVGYNQPLNLVGTMVNGVGVKPGTTVVAIQPLDGWIWLSDPVDVQPGTEETLNFFGPVVARGTVGTGSLKSDQIFIQDQLAYNTLQQLGPLAQIQVTGPGIEPGTFVTIASAPPGTARIVTLSSPLKLKSKPGSYAFTFGHARPYTPPGP